MTAIMLILAALGCLAGVVIAIVLCAKFVKERDFGLFFACLWLVAINFFGAFMLAVDALKAFGKW